MIKGVDVSAYQSSSFSTSGLSFAFIKATEGHTWTSPRLSAQAAHARGAGLAVGFYHFLHPGNLDSQAHYFVGKAKPHADELLAVDWESSSDGAASCAEKDAFIKKVKALVPHHRVLLYCNRDFWLNRDTTSYAGDGLWIADYVSSGHPRIKAHWLVHQYTDHPLDTDTARFDSKAAMKAWAKAGHGVRAEGIPEQAGAADAAAEPEADAAAE